MIVNVGADHIMSHNGYPFRTNYSHMALGSIDHMIRWTAATRMRLNIVIMYIQYVMHSVAIVLLVNHHHTIKSPYIITT